MLHQSLVKNSFDKTIGILILVVALVVTSAATPLAFAQEADTPPADDGGAGSSGTGDSDTADTSTDNTGSDGEPGADTPGGDSGDSTAETDPPDGEPAVIETGDAVAVGDIDNEVNTNETGTGGGGEDAGAESGSGEREETTPRTRQNTDIEVENNNDATIENELDVEADTGENTIENSGGGVIETGDAVAFANVINAVNTNIFNSEGFFLFLNNFSSFGTDIDLRNVNWFDPPEGASQGQGCGFYDCQAVKNLTLQNNNTVSLTNSVVVRASTGENTISGGDGSINTGNAYAAANVVNLVNTNIVDSNYLLLSFNNFGNWSGDIVFPAQNFFEGLFGNIRNGPACSAGGNTTVTNNNSATVENAVTAEANTGENTIEGDANSTPETAEIETGDADANVAIVNQINTNAFCETSFSIIFRIHGNWTGNVFSAPEGVYWTETNGAIEIFSQPPADGVVAEGGVEGTGRGSNRSRGGTNVDIENNNNANIRNNVEVVALTGKNRIAGGGGSISTGNAVAVANVFNIVNTNIVGRNWLLAVINIFGDWEGNIAFGRPNLWVGASVSVPNNPASPGDTVTYTFTVINNGDTDATEVRLTDAFDSTLLALSGGSYSEAGDGQVSWNLGTISPGGSAEVSYQATVDLGIPIGETALTNTSNVTSYEDDEDNEDNSDSVTILAFREAPASLGGGSGGGGGGSYPRTYSDPILELTKSNAADGPINVGDSVDYTIVVENKGYGYAENAKLIDTLVNEDGEVIHEEMWDLGKIFNDEEITITYTTVFSTSTIGGTYTNIAQVFADDYESPAATSTIEVVVPVVEEAEEVDTLTEEPEIVITAEYSVDDDGEVAGAESLEFSIGDSEPTPFLASLGGLFSGYYTLIAFLALLMGVFAWRKWGKGSKS